VLVANNLGTIFWNPSKGETRCNK